MATMAHSCSGVILAGGLNSRMGGRNKAFLEIGGETILARILQTYGAFFDDILVVTRRPDLYPDTFEGRPVRVVTDVFEARSIKSGARIELTCCARSMALCSVRVAVTTTCSELKIP